MYKSIPNPLANSYNPFLFFTDRTQKNFGVPIFRLTVVVGFLTLILGFWGATESTTAHPGFDPEIERLNESLAKEPENIELLIRRGWVYRSNGDFHESLQDLEHAWLLAPQNRAVLFHRALTLSAMKRLQDAEAALNHFLQDESDPQRILALAERAHILAETGRITLAIADLTSAIQLYPTVQLYLERGRLQESIGNLEEAEQGYTDGLKLLGDNTFLLKDALIRVKNAQGQYNQSLNLVQAEASRSAVKTPWRLKEAEIYIAMGNTGASRLAYERALSEVNRILTKRRTAINLITRAKILNEMGRRNEAIQDLQEANQLAPSYREAQRLLLQWGGGIQ